MSSKLIAHCSKKKDGDGGKGKDETIRQCLTDLKRKGIATDKVSNKCDDNGAKKQKHEERQVTPERIFGATPLITPITPGAIYDNAEASAIFFVQVLQKDGCMYILSSLTKSKAYLEMTLKRAKFFVSINRMVVEYDRSAQEDDACIGKAKTMAKETENLVTAEKKRYTR